MEGTFDTGCKKFAMHLVCDDSHVKSEVDLDAGVQMRLAIFSLHYHHVDAEVERMLCGIPFGRNDVFAVAYDPCLHLVQGSVGNVLGE